MSDKSLQEISLDLSKLKRAMPETVQQQAVTALIVALGSNYQAEYHLARVRENLAKLGDIKSSSAFQNPDYTATKAQPKPDYTNQCVYVSLTKSMTFSELRQSFKTLERDCNRQRLLHEPASRQVAHITMDIDILMVKLDPKQNSLSKILMANNIAGWVVLASRYPFRAHEMVGVEELVLTGKTDINLN